MGGTQWVTGCMWFPGPAEPLHDCEGWMAVDAAGVGNGAGWQGASFQRCGISGSRRPLPWPCVRRGTASSPVLSGSVSARQSAVVINDLESLDWVFLGHVYGPADDVPGWMRGMVSSDPDGRKEAFRGRRPGVARRAVP